MKIVPGKVPALFIPVIALFSACSVFGQSTVEVVPNLGPDQNWAMRNNEKSMALGTPGKQYLLSFYCSTSNINGDQRIYESLDNGATWALKTSVPYFGGTINYNRFGSMVMASDQVTLHVTWCGISWASTTCATGYRPWSVYYATYNTFTNTWSTVEKLFNGTTTSNNAFLPDIDLYTRAGNELPVICYYCKNTSWTSYFNYKISPVAWAFANHPGSLLSSSDFFCAPSVVVDANNDFLFTGRIRSTMCASWKNNMYWRWWDESASAWGSADLAIHPWAGNFQSTVFDDSDNLFVALVSERSVACAVQNGLYVAVKNSGSPVWTSYFVDAAGGGYANGTGFYNFGISNVAGAIQVVWADNAAFPTIYQSDWTGAGFTAPTAIVNPGGEAYRFINTYKQENNAYNCLLFDYGDQIGNPYDIWVYNCSAVLPIEMVKFSAELYREKSVRLNWTTATETDNDFFTVQRSSNGIYYDDIAEIDGAGNSSVELDYTYIDHQPGNGINYYRLKQTDVNGESNTSGAVTIIITREPATKIENLYPNPANNELTVAFSTEKEVSEATLEIISPDGRVVLKEQLNTAPGLNSHTVALSQLPSGLYTLKLCAGHDEQVRKLAIDHK